MATSKPVAEKGILPHFYRMIPASFKKYLVVGILLCEILVLLAASGGLFLVYNQYDKAKKARAGEVAQLIRWEETISKHSSYPQAYYNAALHAARLGDSEKAMEYTKEALILNENYEPAKQLQKLLE